MPGSSRWVWSLAPVLIAGGLTMGCAGASRAPSSRPAPDRPVTPAVEIGPTAPLAFHQVRPGETLWSIANQYGTTVDELVRLNRIADADSIEAGVQLQLPVPLGESWSWPVEGGQVLSNFGARRRTHTHKGLDIAGRSGQPVRAVQEGQVVYSGSSMSGYGKTVILDHGDGITSLYAHNSSLLVRVGDRIQPGQVVARIGRSGNATGLHCHLEIRRDDVPVDPMIYLAADGRSR